MEKLRYILSSLLLVAGLAACSSDDDTEDSSTSSSSADAPVLASSSPADGETDVDPSLTTVTLTFDQNIYFASSNASKITLNGASVSKAQVLGTSATLTITVELEVGTSYTLIVPAGLVTGVSGGEAEETSISFTTQYQELSTTLSNPSATSATVELFEDLLENYGSKIYSGTMADVNWNYDGAEEVYEWTGVYPALNCFDYVHLSYSPANWIDYTDITPVKEWHDAGGIVACMWHWNVPNTETSTDVSDMSFYASGTDFSVSNALTEGTWEYEVLYEDLENITYHLGLLQDADIPVIWRPLHEASGEWFWWGADGADAFVSLWQLMYDYFLEAGINNLIWVWTSCEGTDGDWYPGDDYVDIVGIDIYSVSSTSSIQTLFNKLTLQYPDKMLALSECGSIANISDQWSAGSTWSWFMPWYNGYGTDHSDSDWWNDAVSQSYVITR